jgi:hypothetical protein
MEQVQFEEDNSGGFMTRRIIGNSTMPKMSKGLMKFGVVKNEHQANIFLICLSIISLFLAIGVYAYYVAGYNPFEKQTTGINPGGPRGLQQRQAPVNQ